jgi:hypothetical protein
VFNKLGGLEGAERFLRDEFVVKAPERTWQTWMTLKLGMLKNVDEIRTALKRHSFDDWANDIIGHPAFKVSETEQQAELVNVSVGDLGFKSNDFWPEDNVRYYKSICKRGIELGLDLCPLEVGPQLCLQLKDQSKETSVIVAMNTIFFSGGSLWLFSVNCYSNGNRCLNGNGGHAGHIWSDNDRFVFLKRKKQKINHYPTMRPMHL